MAGHVSLLSLAALRLVSGILHVSPRPRSGNRAGDHKWDQPPLVPPVDKEGRQVHVRRVGKDGGKGGRGK